MVDRPGIGLDDLAWIQRDEYDHYVTVARTANDPADWPTFRLALHEAVAAAFGLDDHDPGWEAALEMLDRIRQFSDPARSWPAFFEELWAHRHAIRPDLT